MKIMKSVIVFTVCAAAAALLGHYVARGVAAHTNSKKVRKMAEDRQADNATLLDEMGTIKIGDKLEDFWFVDLEGNDVNLASLVDGESLIMLFDPGCGSCENEISAIGEVVGNSEESKHFILIGAGTTEQIGDYLSDLEVSCHVVCDVDRDYVYGLKLPGYPFNMLVDRDMALEDVVLGAMYEFEIEDFLRNM